MEYMTALTQTISRLTIEIAESNAKLVNALADNNELTKSLPPSLGLILPVISIIGQSIFITAPPMALSLRIPASTANHRAQIIRMKPPIPTGWEDTELNGKRAIVHECNLIQIRLHRHLE